MRAGLLVVSMLALAPRAALAQREGDVVIVVDDGAPDDRARAWRERVLAALGVEPGSVAEWSAAAEPVDTVEPDRLAALGEIESLLVSAHRAATRLEEGDALRRLARAEATALRELTIPGMAAWYAEVELAIARTAAQAGLTGLADAALRRAASVDPTRTVRAAEARPELVERSEAAVRAAVTGPRGRFELRADAESARAFLDDHPLGALPRVVDAPVGPHVLRVEAPGCRSWARIVEVFEGERAPVEIRLAPTEARTNAEGADRAARGGHAGRLEAQLRALRSLAPPAVWMLWIGSGPADRAIAVRCTEGGCAAPRRLEPRSLSALDEEPLARWTASSLASALAWLDARPETASVAEPWWERWYVWVAAGVVMAAAAAAIGVAAQPRGPGPLQIEIDPGHLPTR